jgi:hypothetical protein
MLRRLRPLRPYLISMDANPTDGLSTIFVDGPTTLRGMWCYLLDTFNITSTEYVAQSSRLVSLVTYLTFVYA